MHTAALLCLLSWSHTHTHTSTHLRAPRPWPRHAPAAARPATSQRAPPLRTAGRRAARRPRPACSLHAASAAAAVPLPLWVRPLLLLPTRHHHRRHRRHARWRWWRAWPRAAAGAVGPAPWTLSQGHHAEACLEHSDTRAGGPTCGGARCPGCEQQSSLIGWCQVRAGGDWTPERTAVTTGAIIPRIQHN
jgi:hypothetical protein